MNYEIANEITTEEYMKLREIVGWKLFPLEQAEEALKHTAYLCCLKKDGKTIGTDTIKNVDIYDEKTLIDKVVKLNE